MTDDGILTMNNNTEFVTFPWGGFTVWASDYASHVRGHENNPLRDGVYAFQVQGSADATHLIRAALRGLKPGDMSVLEETGQCAICDRSAIIRVYGFRVCGYHAEYGED